MENLTFCIFGLYSLVYFQKDYALSIKKRKFVGYRSDEDIMNQVLKNQDFN